MIISNLRIHNFRSIKDVEIVCQPLTTLLGPNNHGKSNVLAALDFFFSPSAKPQLSELFAFDTREDNEIWVEITFEQLTDQEQKTFQKYVQVSQQLCIRKTAAFDGNKPAVKYQGWVAEPSEEWLKAENAGNYRKLDDLKDTPLYEVLKDGGKLSKAKVEGAQQRFIHSNKDQLELNPVLEPGNLLGPKTVAAGVLPEFYLVPAVRDLSEETKIKNTALLGRLVNRAVQIMSASNPAFREIQEKLDAQFALLNGKEENGEPKIEQIREIKSGLEQELKAWGVKIDLEIDTPPIEKIFELGTLLHIDDGVRTGPEQKGHGLQRALIFALLKTWAALIRQQAGEAPEAATKPRMSSESVYFAIEEPELFLHPQAQREFAKSLSVLAKDGGQVFICTHASEFIDMSACKSICLISKYAASEGSVVRQSLAEIFDGDSGKAEKSRFNMAYWINPDRGEMFFARKVVFVEGATEKTIIPFLAQKMQMFRDDISIIDCGSKHNLPLYIAIANAYSLDYVVVHDEDPLPDPVPENWLEDKIKAKRDTYRLNAEIEQSIDSACGLPIMMAPEFEMVAGVSKNQGEKIGKPLAALNHFEKLAVDEFPEPIKDLVARIYRK